MPKVGFFSEIVRQLQLSVPAGTVLRLVSTFRVPCSSAKNVGKTTVPALQEPFLHDFLQEKNILKGLQNRVYAGPFTLVELSFATVVCEQISRQFCVPFCLISV